MSKTMTVRTPVDVWVNEAVPAENHSAEDYLSLNGGTSVHKYAFMFFASPFPIEATVSSALLNLYLREAWSGTTTITVKRVTAVWSEASLTYATIPVVTATNAGTAQVVSGTIGQKVTVNLTAMMADVTAGAAFYGFRIEIDTTGDKKLHSARTVSNGMAPTLELDWTEGTSSPIDLAPSGNQVTSQPKPYLDWAFNDLIGDTSQAKCRVQIATDALFASVVWDSTLFANELSQLDLAYNLISAKNQSDAETDTTGFYAVSSAALVRTTTSGEFYAGVAALKITAHATNANSGAALGNAVANYAPVVVGASYTFSAFLKKLGAGTSNVHLDIVWKTSGGATISTTSGTATAQPAAFAVLSTTGTAPATAAYAELRVLFTSAGATNIVGVDCLQFENAASASAWRPAFTALTSADSRYWHVMAEDGDGQQSDYSDAAQFTYYAHGTLAITVPGSTTGSTAPTVTHTFTGQTQAQSEYVLYHDSDGDGAYEEIYRRGRQTTTATDFSIPPGYVVAESRPYRVVVRVWDDRDRATAPGARTYVEDTQDFTYVRDGTPAAVATLTATYSAPAVVLTWTRSAAPTYFALKVDGVMVDDRIVPADVFVSGTTYQMNYYGYVPGTSHTYEIEAVELV